MKNPIVLSASVIKRVSWASVSAPFIFIIPGLASQLTDSSGSPHQAFFYVAINVWGYAPLPGLVLGVMAWKSTVGKVGVILNGLALAYNVLYIFVLLPQALQHTKLGF